MQWYDGTAVWRFGGELVRWREGKPETITPGLVTARIIVCCQPPDDIPVAGCRLPVAGRLHDLYSILLISTNFVPTEFFMKKLVILTGAGMSSESGIKTFRDSGGLWEEYDVNEVATPMAWSRNRDLVLRFYNERRRQLEGCSPNAGHYGIAAFEKQFDVHVITQNIDNLHERAGSTKVLHLHGELTKARSTTDPSLIYDIGYNDINPGDKCEKGSQLRPHIVWFGEAVPMMDEAIRITETADIFVVIGSSLNVYPAAGLINYAPDNASLWLIDPKEVSVPVSMKVEVIRAGASEGVAILAKQIC